MNPIVSDPSARRFGPAAGGRGIAALVSVALVIAGLRIGLPIYSQHAAVKAAEACGAIVLAMEGGPDWLRRWAGDGWMAGFDRVECIAFRFPPNRNSDEKLQACLSRLWAVRNLRDLDFGKCQLTDGDLAAVGRLENLTGLSISSTGLSAAALQSIERLRNLTELNLCGSSIGDDGLFSCGKLDKLVYLRLDSTPVTDDGLVHLGGLKYLRQLSVSNTQVTPAGLGRLTARITGLEISDD